MKPAISVVLSAYNTELFIAEAISSILDQTFTDFEFIIIDDGSTDRTLAVINRFEDSRIKVIVNENNLGLAASLNKGMKEARGKYIARMDADDISDLKRFEIQYDFLEKHPTIDVCVTPMKLFGSEISVSGSGHATDAEIKSELVWGTPTNHATMLIRTEKVARHSLYYDESFGVGQDWKYWFDIRDFVNIARIEAVLYSYRRGEHNVTVQFRDKSKDRSLRMHTILLQDMGISFSSDELLMHQFINGLFSIEPSKKAVKAAHTWYLKLLRNNLICCKYDAIEFERNAKRKWDRLFFLIVPYGFTCVLGYIIASGISWAQFLYYVKYNIRSIIRY